MTTTITTRLPLTMVARLDAQVEACRRSNPATSRADLIRLALSKFLKEETEHEGPCPR